MGQDFELKRIFTDRTPLLDEHVRHGAADLGLLFIDVFSQPATDTEQERTRHERAVNAFTVNLIRMRREHERYLPHCEIDPGTLNTNSMLLPHLVSGQFDEMRAPGGIFASTAERDREQVRRFVLQNTSDLVNQAMAALACHRQATAIRFLLGQKNHFNDLQAWIRQELDLPTENALLQRVNKRLAFAHMTPYPASAEPPPRREGKPFASLRLV